MQTEQTETCRRTPAKETTPAPEMVAVIVLAAAPLSWVVAGGGRVHVGRGAAAVEAAVRRMLEESGGRLPSKAGVQIAMPPILERLDDDEERPVAADVVYRLVLAAWNTALAEAR